MINSSPNMIYNYSLNLYTNYKFQQLSSNMFSLVLSIYGELYPNMINMSPSAIDLPQRINKAKIYVKNYTLPIKIKTGFVIRKLLKKISLSPNRVDMSPNILRKYILLIINNNKKGSSMYKSHIIQLIFAL